MNGTREILRTIDPVVQPANYKRDCWTVVHLVFHLSLIVSLCVTCALQIHVWPAWLVLILAAVAGHSMGVLGFAAHEVGHGIGKIRPRFLRRAIEQVGWTFSLFATPTIQRRAHNVMHHRRTNTFPDPDRRLTLEEVRKVPVVAKIATLLFPNGRHPWLTGVIGWGFSVFSYHTSLLVNSLFATGEIYDMRFTRARRFRVLLEFLWNVAGYGALWWLSGFAPLMFGALALMYFCGASLAGGYIATNHLLVGQSEEETDALANTVSLKVPRWVDFIHLNFSHHVEHHLYPSLPANALPAVRAALMEHFPERYKLLSPREAMGGLLAGGIVMLDRDTLVYPDGKDPSPIRYPLRAEPAKSQA